MKLHDIVFQVDSAKDDVVKVISIFHSSPISGKLKEVLKLEGSEVEWESFQKRLRKVVEK
jgi:hypothetical protein